MKNSKKNAQAGRHIRKNGHSHNFASPPWLIGFDLLRGRVLVACHCFLSVFVVLSTMVVVMVVVT